MMDKISIMLTVTVFILGLVDIKIRALRNELKNDIAKGILRYYSKAEYMDFQEKLCLMRERLKDNIIDEERKRYGKWLKKASKLGYLQLFFDFSVVFGLMILLFYILKLKNA